MWPIESNAPALTSDSMTRLLHTTSGAVSRKPWKLTALPCCSRAATMPSTTLCPTLRTAVRPNRMSVPIAVKLAADSFTSGGST